jgi:C_GCAxxG_C_C family probable redox protein
MNSVEKTMELCNQGLNCSQAIITAFGEPFGVDAKTAKNLGRPWGGGMGHLALTCGALTGAVAILGLARNDSDEQQARQDAFESVRELFHRFEAKHGATACKDLLGADMSTAAGKKKINEEKLTSQFCPGIIRDTAEILADLMKSQP